jgi:hypothetical protein
MAAATVKVKVTGAREIKRQLRAMPLEVRKELTSAMRKAAIPAKARASAAVHWKGPVQVRARQGGAKVGSSKVYPPIIEFGNKAVIGPGGKVAPHVRKLHRKPALVEAVESTVGEARDIAEHEIQALLDRLINEGTLHV